MLKYNDPLLVEKLTDMVINHETYKEIDIPFTHHLLLGKESFSPNELSNTLKDRLSRKFNDVQLAHKLTFNKTGQVCTLIVSLGNPVVNLLHDVKDTLGHRRLTVTTN